VLLGLGSCLLAVVMHWPLALNLGADIPKDLGDPLVQAWQVSWDGHALANQPLDFFQANQFWPLENTLAFSDALIGYAPAGLVGSGPEAAVARYDLLFLFAYALCFAGAYLLARELGLGPVGAAVAGAAFAYAPYRLEQDGHMHIISSGGIPLALALLVRGYRLGRGPWILAGFCVAAWQLSLGFSLGLPFAYLLAALAVLATALWLRAGRPALPGGVVVATIAGALVFVTAAAVLSRPYMEVVEDHPYSRRTADVVENFSGGPRALAVAPDENSVWDAPTAAAREGLENIPEKTLFPGLVTLALAVGGLIAAPLPRGVRIGLGAGVVAFTALALGFRVEDGMLWPYRIAYELLPGLDGIRVPGRLFTFSTLGLALLAGAGADAAGRTLARRRSGRGRGRFLERALRSGVLAALLVVALAIEGRGLPFDPLDDQAQPEAPAPPVPFSTIAAPQLHLPAARPEDNRRYLLWSTDGFPETVNGRSSLQPRFTASVIDLASDFPEPAAVGFLRKLGVRSVVLHLRRVSGTAWERTDARPLAKGVERERRGEVLVYEIRSPNAGSGTGRGAEERAPRSSR
jgi:hypothetical protein